jgi:serine-type D-Ala-D-Ala carboxypeptidase (penicillin-binding protein 5/6)
VRSAIPVRPVICALALIAAALPAAALPATSAPDPAPLPFSIPARAAILIDQATGRVLYEHNADEPLPPASLAKLMTLHLVYEKLEERTIRPDDVVSLTANSWALNQTPGSSLMNLEPGQIVTVDDLMKGTAIMSGNDAATALAEYVAGSTEKFVALMNEESRWMGYKTMRFTDPAGVRQTNVVNAREFADFCRRYIQMHPQSLAELLSVREFEYPLPRNIPDGWPRSRRVKAKPVKQYNGNYLVWDGIDGLKTGHLDDANFTAAVTARRGETRLIAVLLGVPGRTPAEGYRRRAESGRSLLNYGFRTYRTIAPQLRSFAPVRVWKGREERVGMTPARAVTVTASRSEVEGLTYSIVTPAPVVAPVQKGQRVAELVFSAGGREICRIDLLSDRSVEAAGLLKRAWDTVQLGFGLLRGEPAQEQKPGVDAGPRTSYSRTAEGGKTIMTADSSNSRTAYTRGSPR